MNLHLKDSVESSGAERIADYFNAHDGQRSEKTCLQSNATVE